MPSSPHIWRTGAGMKRRAERAVTDACREQRARCFSHPVRVTFRWYERDRRRDWDNVVFAKKFILDGLVKAGVLPDDSQSWVIGLRDVLAHDRDRPRVVVEVSDE